MTTVPATEPEPATGKGRPNRGVWLRWLLLSLAGLALASALLIFLRYNPEPSYAGRSFSQWCTLQAELTQAGGSETESREAIRAIRRIGTNGLPILLRSLRDSSLSQKLRGLANRLPAALSRSRLLRLALTGDRVDPSAVFQILGPQASPAVPELAALLRATNRPDIASEAAACLAAIGPAGAPALVEALGNPRLPSCRYAAFEFSSADPAIFGTNAALAIPALAQLAVDTDSELARLAIRALGRINRQPQLTVPALIVALHSTDNMVRYDAARSLMWVGGSARSAVPALLQCFNDPDWGVRSITTNALLSIAPETLEMPP
jgi:HEAT repeat protein